MKLITYETKPVKLLNYFIYVVIVTGLCICSIKFGAYTFFPLAINITLCIAMRIVFRPDKTRPVKVKWPWSEVILTLTCFLVIAAIIAIGNSLHISREKLIAHTYGNTGAMICFWLAVILFPLYRIFKQREEERNAQKIVNQPDKTRPVK